MRRVLGAQAKDILALIDRFGGQDTAALKTAVHELEDQDAPLTAGSAAKLELKSFLTSLLVKPKASRCLGYRCPRKPEVPAAT